MAKDMRTFMDQVAGERPGEILVVDEEVDPKFGITGIAAKLAGQNRFPAVFCRKVRGSRLPVIINLTASYDRLALAVGTTTANMVPDYANRPSAKIPPKIVEKSQAPVKEVILKGNEARMSLLPVPTHNELDAGPYITGDTLICKDPDTGALNAGMYRIQVQKEQQLGVWMWDTHHGAHIRRRHEELGKEMAVAVAIGHHPAYIMAAVSTLPGIGGELEEAGALLGEPLEVVPAETVDLLVPARAEIVIEGKMLPGERAFEGPFAEWPGTYVAEGDKPFIRVTAITMRKDAIYYDVFSSNREHTVLGSLPRMGVIYRAVKQYVPGVKNVNIPSHGRMYCYISIKKETEMDVKRAALAALNVEPFNLKTVVVVDDDIDVFNDAEVLWAIGTRCHMEKDLTLLPRFAGPGGLNPVGYEFHSDGTKTPVMISALIVDATKPAPPTPYPPRAKVPQAVLDRIDLGKMLKEFKGFGN
ncbi:MAG TPA: UbiD family decarboxylase [Deltaproteobacteria bacterium]|nr:UbiD family decarboxylase [Deltaproteobacteria bacterium]